MKIYERVKKVKEQLISLKERALSEIKAASSMEELDGLRVKYSGKKGELTAILKGMGKLSAEERPEIGKIANDVREAIENEINTKKEEIKKIELNKKLDEEVIDVTMPGKTFKVGKRHPITQIIDEVTEIFMGIGFSVAEGPEVETVENNFDALNAPKNHPSRDITDTFYFNDELLLRTQTSPVQVRTMRSEELPIKIISPGRCFRNDSLDATHSPMFHQIEGLVVGKDITMAQFKGTLELFVKKLFGDNTRTKFRPHNFPFTEPSAEIDVTCFKCGGKGCQMCKGEGWIEILGAGMVHPNVLRNCGIDPEVYSGFAFGMGVERLAMLKYEIDDIRLLVENDMRFLDQF
ncbi:phenylalanine--tRNA ligase subunit alpha [Terrisporobacter vanillatitrophus]|uniref:phenylalanine--tRNA ligase subunit alpha n=1 Tax=Terrisporobacter vanillatitrophus TaxID=3058402 RepID=UPI003EC1302D